MTETTAGLSMSEQMSATTAPARSAEVIGMLGETVVSVTHLEAPRASAGKRSSYLLLAAAVILLAVATFAFARGVANAAANQRALDRWTLVEELPAHEFRPHLLSPAYDDYMAFGGLLCGLAALGLGLLRLRGCSSKSVFSVGQGSDADFAASAAPASISPLVSHLGEDIVVSVGPGMHGEIERGGTVVALDLLTATGVARPSTVVAGGYDVRLPDDGKVRVVAGPSSFLVSSAPATRTRLAAFSRGVDRRAVSFFAVSAIAHLALVALLATIPASSKSLALDLGSGDRRTTLVHTRGAQDPIATNSSGSGEKGEHEGSARIPGEKGQSGTPDSSANMGSMKVKQRAETPSIARAEAMKYARNAGIAGALRRTSNIFQDIHSYADFTSGSDSYDQWGLGDEDGWRRGEFGHSDTGFGPGNGSPSDLIRIGDFDTRTGDDDPWIDDEPDFVKKHESHKPVWEVSDAEIIGTLDKSIVGRYIKRKRAAITHCYERELLVNSDLSGTLTALFLIDGNGAVVYSRSTGMANKSLGQCVDRVISGIQFPRSEDGGTVNVTYPFHFHQAGR